IGLNTQRTPAKASGGAPADMRGAGHLAVAVERRREARMGVRRAQCQRSKGDLNRREQRKRSNLFLCSLCLLLFNSISRIWPTTRRHGSNRWPGSTRARWRAKPPAGGGGASGGKWLPVARLKCWRPRAAVASRPPRTPDSLDLLREDRER